MLEINKENSLFMQGFKLVAGLDEAGRGPLAGPVVAAVAVLNPEILLDSVKLEKLKGINDSKKISAKKREELFDIIKENFFEIGVGVVNHQTIDRINILQATFLAMKMALGNLKSKPDILLVDGKFPIPNLSLRQEAIINGDALIFSIAAASIVAKVTRDRLMDEYDKKYPQYGFAKHKGYGTPLHLEMLQKHGPSPVHRKSFAPVRRCLA